MPRRYACGGTSRRCSSVDGAVTVSIPREPVERRPLRLIPYSASRVRRRRYRLEQDAHRPSCRVWHGTDFRAAQQRHTTRKGRAQSSPETGPPRTWPTNRSRCRPSGPLGQVSGHASARLSPSRSTVGLTSSPEVESGGARGALSACKRWGFRLVWTTVAAVGARLSEARRPGARSSDPSQPGAVLAAHDGPHLFVGERCHAAPFDQEEVPGPTTRRVAGAAPRTPDPKGALDHVASHTVSAGRAATEDRRGRGRHNPHLHAEHHPRARAVEMSQEESQEGPSLRSGPPLRLLRPPCARPRFAADGLPPSGASGAEVPCGASAHLPLVRGPPGHA